MQQKMSSPKKSKHDFQHGWDMWAWQRIGKPCLIGFRFLHIMHAHVAYCILHTYIIILRVIVCSVAAFSVFFFFVMLYVLISIQFDFHNCRLNKKLFLAICIIICLCPLFLLHCGCSCFSVFSFDSKVVFFLPLILLFSFLSPLVACCKVFFKRFFYFVYLAWIVFHP